jgi:transposase
MAERKDFTLTDEELDAIDLAIRRDKRTGLARRATAVRLLHLGHKPEAVAEMVAASIPSVYGWHERFRQSGVDGLANKEKRPRRRKVTATYLEKLDQALEHDPDAFGYEFAIWTRERLRDHLEQETGVKLSLNWLGTLMQERGYVFRRPKHDLSHRQDEAAKAATKAVLEELKKTSASTISSSSLWTKRP